MKIDYDGCVMEHLISTIGGPKSCEDCIYYQDCYPPEHSFDDDDFDLHDFDDDENNQYLAYISSL